MTGKLKLEALPVGRFLYTVNGSGPIREGRVLEQCADPEGEGCWLKLWPGPDWVWSGEIWIETELPETDSADKPETAAPETSSPAPPQNRRKKKFFK